VLTGKEKVLFYFFSFIRTRLLITTLPPHHKQKKKNKFYDGGGGEQEERTGATDAMDREKVKCDVVSSQFFIFIDSFVFIFTVFCLWAR
jgi:hypothetical protein